MPETVRTAPCARTFTTMSGRFGVIRTHFVGTQHAASGPSASRPTFSAAPATAIGLLDPQLASERVGFDEVPRRGFVVLQAPQQLVDQHPLGSSVDHGNGRPVHLPEAWSRHVVPEGHPGYVGLSRPGPGLVPVQHSGQLPPTLRGMEDEVRMVEVIMAKRRSLVAHDEESGLAIEQPVERVSGVFVSDPDLGSAAQGTEEIAGSRLTAAVELTEGAEANRLD